MKLHHFSVTQLRTAATCPRIHYFDQYRTRERQLERPHQTRVWLPGAKSEAGGGALFHHVVERFNRVAAEDAEVLGLIERAEGERELQQGLLRYVNFNCIDLHKLSLRSVPLRQAFIGALTRYFEDLAGIVNYALSNGISPQEVVTQLFGDNRRRLDVTFHLNGDEQAHVTGTVDYVFYDWRTRSHRVVDYKLISYDHANRDLFQVSAYALMHHFQHATQPDVAVFYRHPEVRVIDKAWSDVHAERHKVYDLLASMVQWANFDERTGQGLRPPGEVTWCAGCKWNRRGECEARLGPKGAGAFCHTWEDTAVAHPEMEPRVERTIPPPPPAEDELLEPDLEEYDTESGWFDEADPINVQSSRAQLENDDSVAAGAPPSSRAESVPSAAHTDRSRRLVIGRRGETTVELDANVIKTHIAVVGAAGSGKTWTAKVVAEEVLRAGVPVIAVDPQGDLVQMMLGRDETELTEEQRAQQRAFREKVEPRIFTPGTSHGIRLSLSPLRLPTQADLARIEKPERRREEEEAMLQAVAANLVSLAKVGGEEESQRTFVYQVLCGMNRNAEVTLRDVVAGLLEPENLGIEDADFIIRKTEREKLARKLNAFVIGPARNLFSGGVPLDLDAFTRPSRQGKVPLNVIYLNALTDDDQKHFFLASLASEIYRWMVTSLDATTGSPNLLFYIDEARDWIPAGTKNPPAKQPLIRLFTQGRKYGVGCLLCTQSPRSVDYNVFGNCSTKIIGRMEASQDIERIGEWFSLGGTIPPWIAHRKGAEKGTFVARWPGMPLHQEGEPFTGRLLYSAHEGAWSPDRVEREVDGTDMRDRAARGEGRP